MRYWSPAPRTEGAPPAGVGVLVTNLGTPDAPTPRALRRYLREFLGDPRVVEAPRLVWWGVLNLIVLPSSPRRSAALYRTIWTDEGSPLLVTSRSQARGVAERLERSFGRPIPVALGMRYGNPSIRSALRELAQAGCDRILVLPLYPQYSGSTTGSTFDAIGMELEGWRSVPGLRTVRSYANDERYIAALAASVREHWERHGKGQRLLMSFHGIPQRYEREGDPYPIECRATAEALAAELDLDQERWIMTFQSRFGPEPWLQPYTDETLIEWGRAGVGPIDTICPGFSADCLETLEEMAITNRELYEEAGGDGYRYIPALNDRSDHLDALAAVAARHLKEWTS